MKRITATILLTTSRIIVGEARLPRLLGICTLITGTTTTEIAITTITVVETVETVQIASIIVNIRIRPVKYG